MHSIKKSRDKLGLKILKKAKVGISIIKSRDSRDVPSVFRLGKRYKQTKFSLNKHTTLLRKANTQKMFKKKELQLK